MTTEITFLPYVARQWHENSHVWHVVESGDDTLVATILVRMWKDTEECMLVVTQPSPFPRSAERLSLGDPLEHAIGRFLSEWFPHFLDEHRLRLEAIARELRYSEESIVECRNDSSRVHCIELTKLLSDATRTSVEKSYSRRIKHVIENHERES